MAIARIQIDFGILDGEKLEDFLEFFGDFAIDVLDPHEPDEDCVRWVAIEATLVDESEYVVGFTPEEDEELNMGVPDLFRMNAENN